MQVDGVLWTEVLRDDRRGQCRHVVGASSGDVVDDLRRRGGTARGSALVAAHGREALERAVRGGEVLRLARGAHGLRSAPPALLAAGAASGVVSHAAAARLWLVDTLHQPTVVDVTVPRTARRRPAVAGVRLHWSTLAPHDVQDGVTSPVRTVVDCARRLPFAESLGIADGFLRRGLVGAHELRQVAEAARGPGRARLLRVADAADGRSANPFESALRAAVLEEGITSFVPQVTVVAGDHGPVRPDLLDVRRRIALEADSFAWHGSRAALARDCRRYNALVLGGFLVLRFSWEQVVGDPASAGRAVCAAVRLVDARELPRPDLHKRARSRIRGR